MSIGWIYPIINFGRYCSASARCADWISSLPARSAMARAGLRMRWYARADKFIWLIAARIRLWPSSWRSGRPAECLSCMVGKSRRVGAWKPPSRSTTASATEQKRRNLCRRWQNISRSRWGCWCKNQTSAISRLRKFDYRRGKCSFMERRDQVGWQERALFRSELCPSRRWKSRASQEYPPAGWNELLEGVWGDNVKNSQYQ